VPPRRRWTPCGGGFRLIGDHAKSLAETMAGSVAFIGSGMNLFAGLGMSSASIEAAAAEGFAPFAAMSGSSMRIKTGSHVDLKGMNLAVGFSREVRRGDERLIFGPIVEYGRGSYDSYLDDGTHGSGKTNYLGAGMMAKIETKSHNWVDGSLRIGRTKSDYTGLANYDTTSTYYGIQVGVGKDFHVSENNTVGAYVRYAYAHTAGTSAHLSSGETFDLIVTNPSTDYQVSLTNGDELDIKSASELPDPAQIKDIREPWIDGEIVVPQDYIGAVIQLIVSKRGRQKNLSYIDERALISFAAPLANLLTDFYDQLKSVTSGYGSFNYELRGYQAEDLVRVDFYVAGEMVDALSVMCHRSESQRLGREVVKKLKDVVPRQSFEVALQAAIGGKFIARENIGAYRKDVTGYLYGGDGGRKKKLLAKQARGKKRMKRFGKVDIPSEAFTVMLKRD